MALEELVN